MKNTLIEDATQKENYRFLKYIAYCIIGISGGFIASLIGLVWIRFKSKQNKNIKYAVLVGGFILTLLFTQASRYYITLAHPETTEIKTLIKKDFPKDSLSIGYIWNKKYNNGVTLPEETTLVITHRSKNLLSSDEAQKIAIATCKINNDLEKPHTYIAIISEKMPLYPFKIPFFHYTFSAKGSCEQWTSEETTNRLEQIFPK